MIVAGFSAISCGLCHYKHARPAGEYISRDGDIVSEDEDMRVLTESTVACISQRHPLIPPSILTADWR